MGDGTNTQRLVCRSGISAFVSLVILIAKFHCLVIHDDVSVRVLGLGLVFVLFLEVNSLQVTLSCEDTGMSLFLLTIEASHQDNKHEKNSEGNHERIESFIVEIVGREGRRDFHLVGDIVLNILEVLVSHALNIPCVVQDDEDI